MLIETRDVSGLYGTVRRLVSARRVIGCDGCFVSGRNACATIDSTAAGPRRKLQKRDASPPRTEAGAGASEFLRWAERMGPVRIVWSFERLSAFRLQGHWGSGSASTPSSTRSSTAQAEPMRTNSRNSLPGPPTRAACSRMPIGWAKKSRQMGSE
jgi:hypothetical protein